MKTFRTWSTTLAIGAAIAALHVAPATAVTLSTPHGMKTQSNTPVLSWSTAENEIADQLRVSKWGKVNADGQLVSRYTSLAGDALTVTGLTGGNTSEWAGSSAAPLWPGTYFWQVQSTTTNDDGTTTQAWSPVRKLVVKRYFGGIGANDSMLNVSGQTATTTMVMKVRTNAKAVPFRITYRLNGHVYCASTKPFRRVDDIGQLVATVALRVKLKASYYRRGTNTITVTGALGSAATTGKVIKIKETETFRL